MKKNDLALLKQRLSEHHASLLLGAGFSYGAKNMGGNNLLLGRSLARDLFTHFYVDFPPSGKTPEYINGVAQLQDNLLSLCSIMRSEGRADIRDEYLTHLFTGCTSSGNQFHHKLRAYPWNTIFSLNIDDLVENIFHDAKTPLCIWNKSSYGEREPGAQTLIKLHGDVRCPQDGFVFDKEEYRSFTSDSNCLLKEFAHIFTSSDMVILGTEFQEDDISYVLELYKRAGYSNSGYHYFFVSPKINDVILINTIESTPNFHWIEMCTEDFLVFLSKEVIYPESNRNLIKERGAIFIDECVRQENYVSQVYSGRPTQYNDFFFDWDIRYPQQIQTTKSLLNDVAPSMILTLYGKPYCGKTTVAKRFMVDLLAHSFIAIELSRLDYDVYDALSQYLTILPRESQVVFFVENAAYQYEHIVSFVKKHYSSVQKLVFITTDSTDNHKTRSHHLVGLPEQVHWHSLEISEAVDGAFSGSIFYSLCVKKRLNNYLKLCVPETHPVEKTNMPRICSEMQKANDVIDVLYYSSEGKYFRDYYSNWIDLHGNDFYAEYLCVLSALGKIGISRIPLVLLGRLIPFKAAKFNAEQFLSSYPELLHEDAGYVKLLRSRIVGATLKSKSDTLIRDALFTLVTYTLGLFNEGDKSEAYEFFQKALRVKRLRNNSLLSFDQIKELFISLEKYCASVSYFWVQYGLISQLNEDYDEANNHFLYAKRIRENSYQVAHALAKNRMEIGLFELKEGKSTADEQFLLGCTAMEELIRDPQFDKAFNYSVHSYAVMLMKYHDAKRIVIPADLCEKLHLYFTDIIAKPIDEETKNIIIRFCRYCKDHKCPQFSTGLDRVKYMATYVSAADVDDSIDFS